MQDLIEDAAFQLVRFERRNKIWELRLDHHRHVSQPAPEIAEDGKRERKVEIVCQGNGFEPAQGRDGFQQMAPIAVDVHHTAIKSRQNSLHRLTSPFFKIIDGSHVKGIDALGNNAPGNPLHHVAARSTRQQWRVLKEGLLHFHVQPVSEFNRLAHFLRVIHQLEVSLGGAEKLENKVEAVDQDEMADPEFALARLTEQFQFLKIKAVPSAIGGRSPAWGGPPNPPKWVEPSTKSNHFPDAP